MRILTARDIGALIQSARLEAEMTQTDLARKTGVSRFWIAQVEKGKPRAELALVLKALKALRLVLTIERDEPSNRERADSIRVEPSVDLAAILKNYGSHATHPMEWREPSSSKPRRRGRK